MNAINSKEEEDKVLEDNGTKGQSKEDCEALLVVEPAERASVLGLVVGQEGEAEQGCEDRKIEDQP